MAGFTKLVVLRAVRQKAVLAGSILVIVLIEQNFVGLVVILLVESQPVVLLLTVLRTALAMRQVALLAPVLRVVGGKASRLLLILSGLAGQVCCRPTRGSSRQPLGRYVPAYSRL
ncbi:MAG: hypothetical protein QXP27_07180 [Candidatus Methanomethyliaceae archaeon]